MAASCPVGPVEPCALRLDPVGLVAGGTAGEVAGGLDFGNMLAVLRSQFLFAGGPVFAVPFERLDEQLGELFEALALPVRRCPHGRPIFMRMSRDELYRSVKRIVV